MFIKGLWDAVFRENERNKKPNLVLGAPAKSKEELRERMLTAAVINPPAFGRYLSDDKKRSKTSPAMLRRRAVASKMTADGKRIQFVRGKLLGGEPRLWRA